MPRYVNLPKFRCWLPENRASTTSPGTRTHDNNTEEAPTMTKKDLLIHIIQHSEDFPDTGEIDTATAAAIIDNFDPDANLPEITPEEFTDLWNSLIHDPEVMNID